MKTAMQTLLEDIEFLMPETYKALNKKFELKTFYLEKEKQQILTANNRGYKVGRKDIAETANEYYQDTFGDNPEAGI
jgi:hypothetical protein